SKGHGELFSSGLYEDNRSIVEPEVVSTRLEPMLSGVLHQTGMFLAVAPPEPNLPPAQFSGVRRKLVEWVSPKFADRRASDRGNAFNQCSALWQTLRYIGRRDVLLQLLDEGLLLPVGDDNGSIEYRYRCRLLFVSRYQLW